MMFTSLLSFLSPYKLLIKGVALVLMIGALYEAYLESKRKHHEFCTI